MSILSLAKSTLGFLVVLGYLQMLSFCQTLGEHDSTRLTIVASLALPEPSVCVGAKSRSIGSTISFSNHSNADIEITLEKGINVTVEGLFGTRTLKPLLWGGGSISESAPRSSASHALLRPNESAVLPFQLRIMDGVYSEPGFYKVKVAYDMAGNRAKNEALTADSSGTTNWAIFEVRECQAQNR